MKSAHPMPEPGRLRNDTVQRNLPTTSMLKQPRQERSREMVHAILDATLFVIEEEGADAFTTNRVAEVAGISVGSLYQYFRNKEMLISGAIERGIMDSATTLRDTFLSYPDMPPKDILILGTAAVAQGLHPFRKLLTHVFSMSPIAGAEGAIPILEARITHVLQDWITSRSKRNDPPISSTIRTVASMGVLLMIRWLTDLQDDIPEQEFATHLGEMMYAGLRDELQENDVT